MKGPGSPPPAEHCREIGAQIAHIPLLQKFQDEIIGVALAAPAAPVPAPLQCIVFITSAICLKLVLSFLLIWYPHFFTPTV